MKNTPESVPSIPPGSDAQRRALMSLGDDKTSAGRFLTDDPDDQLVGESEAMADVRETIARVARVDSTVVVSGETGTGKDLVTRLIHRAGPRLDHPFVVVNCSAPGIDLLEAELFGVERLSSVVASGRGRLEEAQGGTLVLDEIGDLPLALQPRVQRFLQSRSVRRVGGTRERTVDVRVVATSQRSLLELVSVGRVRADLYYRLAAVSLELPPLRAHLSDLPALCAHAAAKVARRLGHEARHVADGVVETLKHCAFPGNVRELENLLERAFVLSSGRAESRDIEVSDLPDYVLTPQPAAPAALPLERGFAALAELQQQLERDLVSRAIRRWPELSNSEIAERLGTNRRIFELRLRQYGISKRAR